MSGYPPNRSNSLVVGSQTIGELRRKKQKPVSFQKMAMIQEELAKIEERLETLLAKEQNAGITGEDSMTDKSPNSMFVDDVFDPSLVFMIVVELCQLAASGDATGVRILLGGGADPNSRDYDERTLLHIASMYGHLSVVQALIEFGADITLTDREGKTPFDVAEEHGCVEVVEYLASLAADSAVQPDSFSGPSGLISPLKQNAVDFSSIPQPMMGSLIVVMVGLPGRGKSYVAQQIQRYFQWNGLTCTIFHHQLYQKRIEKSMQENPLDENNLPLVSDTEFKVAKSLAYDITRFIMQTNGVAVLDGTQTTPARRTTLVREIKKTNTIRTNRIVFVEIINDDPDLILKNIMRAREMIPNAPENFVEEYYKVIAQHQAVYKTLNPIADKELTYIRIENQQTYSLNRISGWMPSRLAYLLHNLSYTPVDLYLTRSGEYMDMVAGRIGGNSSLTKRGVLYSMALFEYMKKEMENKSLMVMSSCDKRCTQTLHSFEKESKKKYTGSPVSDVPVELDCRVAYFPTLDDINHGDCEGQRLADVKLTMPSTLQSMQSDPYYTAWPNGECIHQVFNARLEPHIHDIQASSTPILVVSHLHLLQGLYAYFITEEDDVVAPQNAYKIEIPIESLIKITLVGTRRVAQVIDLSKKVNELAIKRYGKIEKRAKDEDFNVFRRYTQLRN